MPHLSPMIWILSPLLFVTLVLPIIMSILWWNQSPIFPNISSSSFNTTTNQWKWN